MPRAVVVRLWSSLDLLQVCNVITSHPDGTALCILLQATDVKEKVWQGISKADQGRKEQEDAKVAKEKKRSTVRTDKTQYTLKHVFIIRLAV